VLPSPQRPETGEEGLPVYSPLTAWLRPGGPASISTEPGREDGVVAITCAMRTPVDPQSEIKGSLYGMDGLALGFLRDWRPWEEPITEEGGKASTSGGGDANEIGTLGRSMTTGGSLLSSTFFCATEARLRPFKS